MSKSRNQDDLLGASAEAEGDGFFGAAEPEKSAIKAEVEDDGPSGPDLLGGQSAAAPQREGYVVLARKYRPQTFDQIVGQENVQQALRGAIATGQISHSYLFSGPRGTGKTSTARILAKAVNCQEGGPRPDPCGRCSSCQSITAGSSLDVIEIDAASNTGVDNIRELRSGVVLAPFSRFKVYIVDEVHMLSTQAFNALLKTLEEPPPQVIFILATTELHKVPETIISRCQSFGFRRFSNNELQSQLGKILDMEIQQRGLSIKSDDREKILELVARNAEGGMRDAQVALDQVLVFSRGTLDFETVRRFLGLAESEALDQFIQAVHGRDIDTLLMMVEEFFASGQDLELFVKNVCEHARDLLIVRSAPSRSELINVSEDRYLALRKIAGELPPSFLLNLSAVFLKLAEEMKSSPQPRFALELALLKMTAVDPVDDLQNILQRLQALEKALGGGGQGSGAGVGAGIGAAPAAAGPRAATPAEYKSPAQEQVRREQDVELSVAETAAILKPAAPLPLVAAAVSVAEPAPVASVPQFSPQGQGLNSPSQLLKCLQDQTAARNQLLHITLLDFARVTSFDGRSATIAVGDPFGLAHLSRPQNQAILREIAKEACGCEILIKLESVQFTAEEQAAHRAEVQAQAAAPPAPTPVVQAAPTGTQPAEPAPATAAVEPARPPGQASAPVAPGAPSAIEPSEYSVYVSPELRRKSVKEVKGDAFRTLLENQVELKELVEKVKDAFGVSDSQFHYRVNGI